MAFTTHVLPYVDDRGRCEPEGRPRTDAACSHRHDDGYPRATCARQSAAGSGTHYANGRNPTGSVGTAKQVSQLKNWNELERDCRKRARQVIENMVELVGIEPTTSSLRTMRSPS